MDSLQEILKELSVPMGLMIAQQTFDPAVKTSNTYSIKHIDPITNITESIYNSMLDAVDISQKKPVKTKRNTKNTRKISKKLANKTKSKKMKKRD